MANRPETGTVKLIAHSPGERAVGISPATYHIKLTVDDPDLMADSDFIADFKKFMAMWLDARQVWTPTELRELERQEAAAERQMERAEREYAKRRY